MRLLTHYKKFKELTKSKNRLKNFFYLAIGPSILFAVSFYFHQLLVGQIREQSQKNLDTLVHAFEFKMNSYIYGLQGMAGIYRIKNFHPTFDELSIYAQSREYFKNFEGIFGMGFIRKIPRHNLKRYLQVQKKINPQLVFKQLDEFHHNELYVIESIFPINRNLKAHGLDVGSEKNRRKGLENSWRAGVSALTDVIQLVQAEKKLPGFLLYYPIYETPYVPIASERYKKLIGFSYAPIYADFIIDYLKAEVQSIDDFNLFVVDGGEYLLKEIENFKDATHLAKKVNVLNKEWIFEIALRWSWSDKLLVGFNWLLAVVLSSFYIIVLTKLMRSRHEQKMILSKKQELENWLNVIMDNIPFSVITTTPDGLIKSVNRMALKLLEYREDELINKVTPALFHDPTEVAQKARELSKEFSTTIEPGFNVFTFKSLNLGNSQSEWTYIAKNGRRFPVRLTVSPLYSNNQDEQKELIGFVGIAEDITKYKELETTIENQRLNMIESARLSSLGEMAGGIAHEINNPLAIISTKVTSIIRKMERGEFDQNRFKEDLQKVDQTVFRISKIINGLRNLSRDSSNDPSEVFFLNEVINESFELCKERFRHESVSLSVKYQNEEIVPIYGKKTQIVQVVINLLNNAFDAVESFDEKWVEVSIEKNLETVSIQVKDSGFGIDDSVVKQMMNPFFTTKKVGKGTGLGLSISKSIIDRHKGELFYQKVNQHTAFTIVLPIYREL